MIALEPMHHLQWGLRLIHQQRQANLILNVHLVANLTSARSSVSDNKDQINGENELDEDTDGDAIGNIRSTKNDQTPCNRSRKSSQNQFAGNK
jgi:hypothetical protein